MRFYLADLLLLMVLVLGWPTLLFAQAGATTGAIIGTIKDAQGGVIFGATITARQVDTNFTRTTELGEDGLFQILQLPPGKYQVSAEAEGFVADTYNITIDIGRTEVTKFTLAVVGSSEVVEVKATSSLDETRTESSTNIDQGNIDTLPINQRDFLNFSLTSARVITDRVPMQGAAQTSGLSFNGQTARVNNITIDGLDNNDSFSSTVRSTFSQDAVQEFQIVSDSYAAEFGRALGGIVNIVTKAGSNEMHGRLFFSNRNDNISAREVFTTIKPPYRQYQFGALLSGPLKKDRIFYFGSFERRTIKQSNIVTISDNTLASIKRQGFNLSNGPLPFSIGTTAALARVDLQASTNDTLWLRYNFGGTYNGALEPFGGLVADTNGGTQRLDDNTIAFNNTYLSSKYNLINESRFLYGRREQQITPIGTTSQVRLVAPEGSIIFGRGPFLPQFRLEHFYQFVNNVTLLRGRHQIKFGADLLYISFPDSKTNVPILPAGAAVFGQIDFTLISGIPGLPLFSGIQAFDPTLRTPEQRAFLITLSNLLPTLAPGFPAGVPVIDLPLPLATIQGFGNTGRTSTQKLFAAFFQDDFKIRANLLIKAGVRFDINRVRFVPGNNGNIAPRIGIAYQPSRLPGISLHGSYGLFFAGPQAVGSAFTAINTTGSNTLKILQSPLPFSILAFAQPGHQFPESNQLPQGVPFIPQLSQQFQYQRDLRNSYAQQINVGFDYLLGKSSTVTASYIFVRGIKLLAARNINPIVRISSINPVENATNGRVVPSQGDLFEFESGFDSYYHAFTISATRRVSTRLRFLASYTFSKAIDNFNDIRTDLQEVNNPLKPGDERGLSLQDVRNRFIFSSIWDSGKQRNPLLSNFQVSTIISLESGRPFNLLTGADLNMNGDNASGDRPLALARNAGVTPGYANVDLRVTRSINLTERCRLQGFIEVFNLFNRVNINTVDRIFSPDAQGNFRLPPQENGRYIALPARYRSAFPPRQLQFGFNLSF